MKNGCAISRRRALALGACALAPLSLARAAFAAKQQPVVVELFTSQGCSSCPAADKLLGEIRNTPGVIAMSINVDYWDYLGWRDTLAEKSHSQRQYDYATARGDMDVYTPQIVVNGSDYCVGSDRSAVMAAISKAQQMPGSPVSLSLANEQDEIILTVSGENGAPGCTIWLMPIAPDITVKIERGENSGSDIVYHNVVRHSKTINKKSLTEYERSIR